MSTQENPTAANSSRLFPEFFLMIGLVLFAMVAASTLAYTAYTRGFSALPSPLTVVAHPH